MRMTVAFDDAKLKAGLQAEIAKLNKLAARTATTLAYRAREAIQGEMRSIFDRPTPYVLNGMQVERASETQSQPFAEIGWRIPFGNKSTGIGAERVLKAQIEGGARRVKRFEKALRLPPGIAAVPGPGARLDQYGNISTGQIVQILSDLRLFAETGYRANRAQGKRRQYTIIRAQARGGKLTPGVYRTRKRGNPVLVLAFVKQPTYRARFSPAATARRVVQEQTAEVWDLANRRALPSWPRD